MYSFQEEKAAFVEDYTEYTISKLHSFIAPSIFGSSWFVHNFGLRSIVDSAGCFENALVNVS